MAALGRLQAVVNLNASCSIYMASSLVGDITKTLGPSPGLILDYAIACTMAGKIKESVFPLPV